MAAPIIYFRGGEDSENFNVGGGSVSTAAGRFRSGFARCGLSNPSAVPTSLGAYVQNMTPFSASSFWTTARATVSSFGGTTNNCMFGLIDSSNLVRLRLRATASSSPPFSCVAEKLDASGTATTLTTFIMPNISVSVTGKLDVFTNYAVAGQFTVYLDGVQLFSFSGDVTTNSLTSLAGYRLSCFSSNPAVWSEMIVSDTDTRTWGLVTMPPAANGNTHNFDTGSPAASNVNGTTTTFLTMDGSTTAGQIDQYTVSNVPAGGYGIVDVAVSALMQEGNSGPANADLGVRTGGADFWSSNFPLGPSFANSQNGWTLNPNTGNPWQASEIQAAGFNIGIKSVT